MRSRTASVVVMPSRALRAALASTHLSSSSEGGSGASTARTLRSFDERGVDDGSASEMAAAVDAAVAAVSGSGGGTAAVAATVAERTLVGCYGNLLHATRLVPLVVRPSHTGGTGGYLQRGVAGLVSGGHDGGGGGSGGAGAGAGAGPGAGGGGATSSSSRGVGSYSVNSSVPLTASPPVVLASLRLPRLRGYESGGGVGKLAVVGSHLVVLPPGCALVPPAGAAEANATVAARAATSRRLSRKAAASLLSASRFVAVGFLDASLRLCTVGGAEGGIGESRAVSVHEGLHLGPVACVAVTPDGSTMVTGGEDDTQVSVWTLPQAASSTYSWRPWLRATLGGHLGAVRHVAASSAYGTIVSASSDGTVMLWDLHRVQYVRTLLDGPLPHAVSALAIDDVTGNIGVAAGHMLLVTDVNGHALAVSYTPPVDSTADNGDTGSATLTPTAARVVHEGSQAGDGGGGGGGGGVTPEVVHTPTRGSATGGAGAGAGAGGDGDDDGDDDDDEGAALPDPRVCVTSMAFGFTEPWWDVQFVATGRDDGVVDLWALECRPPPPRSVPAVRPMGDLVDSAAEKEKEKELETTQQGEAEDEAATEPATVEPAVAVAVAVAAAPADSPSDRMVPALPQRLRHCASLIGHAGAVTSVLLTRCVGFACDSVFLVDIFLTNPERGCVLVSFCVLCFPHSDQVLYSGDATGRVVQWCLPSEVRASR